MSCAAPEGGVQIDEAGLATQAVVAGTVSKDDAPAYPAYARLLNSSGDFVAEVPTGPDGGFRFYAAPGEWTVRVLVPGREAAQQTVTTDLGTVAQVTLAV
ncbi:MAG: DUF1416 domain-containing protein [Streptosporangiales bacterium]|nr:DUF1416 domain-containing protein [Streptosporangiales bacterium]